MEHYSVLLSETIDFLNVRPDGVYVDGTTGGGGHSLEIAKRLGRHGRLICIDRDAFALEQAEKRLEPFSGKIDFVKGNFAEIESVLDKLGIDRIDGMALDLGVSSFQLDDAGRGFSYNAEAPLDMRMDRQSALSAFDVVNGYDEKRIRKILFEYGEEKFSGRIAAAIAAARANRPIGTTTELAEIIKSAIPAAARREKGHPAKRSFQAIRIEVNGELAILRQAISDITKRLNSGGRIAIITFHSLEDRIVKTTFSAFAAGCICPKDFPVCVCGRKPILKILTKKPVTPDERELSENNRSRSAKLRSAERSDEPWRELDERI